MFWKFRRKQHTMVNRRRCTLMPTTFGQRQTMQRRIRYIPSLLETYVGPIGKTRRSLRSC